MAATPWWRDATIYEIYLRSFADGNNDGVGDLHGVIERVGYLASLGIDAIWLTPFYPSPGKDHGYDVSDYLAIDPLFGDHDTWTALVDIYHQRGIKVLIDVVPAHTSNEHPWFQRALAADKDSPYRSYYHWHDPAPDGGPPNNWLANFGGSAWTLDPASGRYYLHSYLPEQPDLNWANPDLITEWSSILNHWLDTGVDGFRIDVAHNLLKNPNYPDNPPAMQPPDTLPAGRAAEAHTLNPAHSTDQDGTPKIYSELRNQIGTTQSGQAPFLLGETVLTDRTRISRYITGPGLDAAMWFGTQTTTFTPDDIVSACTPASTPANGRYGWFLSNHDRSRIASRFGGGQPGIERALALGGLLLACPGPYLLYQGEELGVEDAHIAAEDAADPLAVRAGQPQVSRDRARAPMPFTDEQAGFSHPKPWLPNGPIPHYGSAQTQARNPDSPLMRWQGLLHTWRNTRDGLPETSHIVAEDSCVILRRGPLVVVLNTADTRVALPVPDAPILWASRTRPTVGMMAATSAIWLRNEDETSRHG